MSLRLVKTTGGNSGTPEACSKCGGKHFARSRIAWHCSLCGTYYPTSLGFESLKNHFEEANRLMKEFRNAVNDLERIVKE